MTEYRHLHLDENPFSEGRLLADSDPFHEYDPRDDLEDWQK